jgi:hypothetical protein
MAAIVRLPVAIFGAVVCSGCIPFNYFPSSTVTVTDVFGEPCKGISVMVSDRVAAYPNMEGGTESRLPPMTFTTNERGKCTIPGRFRFAMPFVSGVYVSVNRPDYFAQGDFKVDRMYDGLRMLADKGKDLHVILKPLDIDYRRCNSITDDIRRAACLQYSIFFTAIREAVPGTRKMHQSAVRKCTTLWHDFSRRQEAYGRRGACSGWTRHTSYVTSTLWRVVAFDGSPAILV